MPRDADAVAGHRLAVAASRSVSAGLGRCAFPAIDISWAREYLLEHFSDVDPYNVDWLLNGYGQYLRDRRMVPALQHLVDDTHDPGDPTRDAALKQLALISPEDARVKGSGTH